MTKDDVYNTINTICLLRKIWNFKMIVIGLFLLLVFEGTSAQNLNVEINSEERTWNDANSRCNLLGSKESGLLSELSEIYKDQVPEGGVYWIAAIIKKIPFKFDRCVSITGGNFQNKPLQGTGQPVYDCYEFCTNDIFALSLNQCACTAPANVVRKAAQCKYRLFDKTQMDFYIEDGYLQYMTGNLQVQGTGGGDCAAVILKNGKDSGLIHEFLPCDTQLFSICNNGISVSLQSERRKWTAAVLNCNGTLRGSFDGVYILSNPPSSTTKAWTGISRRSIQQWSNDNITEPHQCLAVSKNNTVQIHVKKCSDLLPYLCEGSEFSLVSSTQLISSGAEASFEVTNFSDMTTTVTSQKTSATYPHSSPVLPAEQDTTPKDGLIPPIVGGAAIGVFILLIVLIVLYRRFQQKARNKITCHSSGTVLYKSHQESATGALLHVGTDDMYDQPVDRRSQQSVNHEQENVYDVTTAPQKDLYDISYRNPQQESIINDNEYGSVNPTAGNDLYNHTNQVFSLVDSDVENYDSMKNLK